eukprot:jgi/Chrzof1/1130/Cz01g41100.t1
MANGDSVLALHLETDCLHSGKWVSMLLHSVTILLLADVNGGRYWQGADEVAERRRPNPAEVIAPDRQRYFDDEDEVMAEETERMLQVGCPLSAGWVVGNAIYQLGN